MISYKHDSLRKRSLPAIVVFVLNTHRWEMSHSRLAAAAYVLEPEFHQHDHAANHEVIQGFNDVLQQMLPDDADQHERAHERALALEQLNDYGNQQGAFGNTAMWIRYSYGQGVHLVRKECVLGKSRKKIRKCQSSCGGGVNIDEEMYSSYIGCLYFCFHARQ